MTAEEKQIKKRSMILRGHKTSISLEDPFWDYLRAIAAARAMTLSALVTEIDDARTASNLSSAIRLHVLSDAVRKKAA